MCVYIYIYIYTHTYTYTYTSQVAQLVKNSPAMQETLVSFLGRDVPLENPLESPLDFKEIQPVHPKGNQSWIFTGRTDAEAETPILWPPDSKNWRIGKDPDAGKDWR